MESKINKTLIKKYVLDIGKFYFYENYMVAEINEGLAFHFGNATEMLKLTKQHYNSKTPFVYISNRKNSYSFNPTSHFKSVPMFPNIKGFASVTYDAINTEIAEMEHLFFTIPSKNFNSLEDAINWVEELIVID